MGLFSKKSKEEKEKAKENARNKFNELKEKRSYILKYYGGHPVFSRESQVYVSVKNDEVVVETAANITGTKTTKLFGVKLSDILKVNIEKEEEVIRRYTATRIALFGPFALAMKKKKVNKKEYLVIECKDFILTFDSNSILCELIYSKLNEFKNNNSNKLNQTEKLEQIKTLKELLDISAITQEEFDIKKKELLGL